MSVRILVGDVRDKLAELADESVHCVVTSPPYWGLRDYGAAGQIGLEADFRDYIATLVAVFHEVRRVLRTGRQVASRSARNHGNESHLGPGLFDAHAPIETRPAEDFAPDSSDLPDPRCVRPASGRSMETRKTGRAPETSPHETAAALSADCIGDSGPLPESGAMCGRMPENRNGVDCEPCAPEMSRATRTASGNARICTCEEDNIFTDHFAVFPPALVEPCILAGCPKGGTVLDPFAGAGTTGLVADRLGRDAVLIEINPAYAEMARTRITKDAGMFAEMADAAE